MKQGRKDVFELARNFWLGCLAVCCFSLSPQAQPPPCSDIFPVNQWIISQACDSLNLPDCLPVSFSALAPLDIYLGGQIYTGPLQGCDYKQSLSIDYTALPGAGMSGPYQVDSWQVDGSVFSGPVQDLGVLLDSLQSWNPQAQWMLDTVQQLFLGTGGGSDYGDLQITQLSSGIITLLGINANLVPQGTQLSLPQGSYWLIAEDPDEPCLDSVWIVKKCQETAWLELPLVVGQTDTLCLSPEELPGTIQHVFNACPDESGELVLVDWAGSSCFELIALEEGVEQACLVLCDQYGVCDTTYVYLEVGSEASLLPVAVADTLLAGSGQPVQLNVLANDHLPGDSWESVTILQASRYGNAVLSPEGLLLFEPDPRYCGPEFPDSLVYEVCNTYGCATATVFLITECEPLVVYDGFSPNGDGINDTFRIDGLEYYDHHYLRIFNRWGALVYESESYTNDWHGTWRGKDLPDGAYYYVLEYGVGGKRSGSIQLQR